MKGAECKKKNPKSNEFIKKHTLSPVLIADPESLEQHDINHALGPFFWKRHPLARGLVGSDGSVSFGVVCPCRPRP